MMQDRSRNGRRTRRRPQRVRVWIPSQRNADDHPDTALREREVASLERASTAAEASARASKSGAKYQGAGVAIAALAAATAAISSLLTLQSLQQQAASDYQKGLDEKLGVAIAAVSTESPEGRISGLTLLQRNTFARIDLAHQNKGDPRIRADAVGVYAAALDIFENYLRAPRFNQQTAASGLGYGKPTFPAEREYALTRLRGLLGRAAETQALVDPGGAGPAIDLSNTQLYRTSWRGIQFGPLTGRFLAGADLRGSLLGRADLTGTDMNGAFLQCANLGGDTDRDATDYVSLRDSNLSGADLRGANLQNADLSGANVTNADFSGANLDGADFTGTTGWDTIKTNGAYSTMRTRGHTFGVGAVGNFFSTYRACLDNPAYNAYPPR